MANEYASGQLVKCSCTFTVSGIPTDPTTVISRFRVGTALETIYTYGPGSNLVRDATGIYHFHITAVSAGTYYYRFEGTTACEAAEEGAFDCLASRF
jgi:hypothetical protein